MSVTPPLDAETRALIAHLVLAAQRRLPHLAVTITPHAHKRWVVDYCCQRVWVDASLTTEAILAALHEALDALTAHLDHVQAAAFIPTQRTAAAVGVP